MAAHKKIGLQNKNQGCIWLQKITAANAIVFAFHLRTASIGQHQFTLHLKVGGIQYERGWLGCFKRRFWKARTTSFLSACAKSSLAAHLTT